VTTSATGRAETEEQAERRMRAVVAKLTAAGLDTRLYETKGVLDIQATLRREGHKAVQVIYEDDGYVEIAYWHDPEATPAQVAATISQALAVITHQPP
jgi:hypothetical protein